MKQEGEEGPRSGKDVLAPEGFYSKWEGKILKALELRSDRT